MDSKASKNEGDETGSQLYVGNLSFSTTEEELQKFFKGFNGYVSATVISRRGGRSKGFGFVNFDDNKSAEAAMSETDGKDIDGRAISVRFAKDRNAAENLCDDRLLVLNLPEGTSKDELQTIFKSFGTLSDVEIISRSGETFAYATFKSADEAKKALDAMNGKDVKGGDDSLEIFYARKLRTRKRRKKDVRERKDSPLDPMKVYIGELSWNATEDQIKAAFKDCGKIEDVSIARTKSGRSKGFAFVTFDSPGLIEKAVNTVNGTEIDGRKVIVAQARDLSVDDDEGATKDDDGDAEDDAARSRTLWIAGVPTGTKLDSIVDFVESKGFTVTGKKPGNNKRGHFFCFVEVETEDAAKSAVEKLDGASWGDDGDDSTLKVQIQQPKKEKKKKKKKKSRSRREKNGKGDDDGAAKEVEYYDNEIYVKGLPSDVSESTLEDLFGKHGDVAVVNVRKNRRGDGAFAFVTFDGDEAAKAAAAAIKGLNETDLDGSTITIEYSRVPRKKRK